MSNRLPSYLRQKRRAWGLTQRELASLLSLSSRTQVAKIESGKRMPSVKLLIASVVLFGASASDLYPGLYSHIEEEVLRQAAALLQALDGDHTPRAERKRELLERALRRAISNSHEGV